MKRTKVIDALQSTTYGQDICVKGWVRSKRGSKGIFFIALNDGSTIKNVQIVGEDQNFDADTIKRITTGACLSVIGTLVESPASGQSSEIQARQIEILGDCDNTYPLQKKGASWEYLRSVAHLRPRTNAYVTIWLWLYIPTSTSMVTITSTRPSSRPATARVQDRCSRSRLRTCMTSRRTRMAR